MKNLAFRTISGIIYVALIIFSLAFNKYSFLVFFIFLSSVMVLELSKGFNTLSGINISGITLVVLNAIIFLSFFFTSDQNLKTYLFFMIIPILVIPLIELLKDNENPILNGALSFFILIYIGLPFGLSNTLYFGNDSTKAYEILLGIFILNWSNDTFAYITGMLFGRHKLFERISPKKSWEGFFGGAIFSVIAAIILSKFFYVLPPQNWVGIALIVTVFGTFGDLVESMLKRQMKLKDIGSIMPGHGGLLDRNDSFLFVVPAVCLYLEIIKLIPWEFTKRDKRLSFRFLWLCFPLTSFFFILLTI